MVEESSRGTMKPGNDRAIGPIISFTLGGKRFGFCICHRRPDRSFSLDGRLFPLCARCTGIVTGAVGALVLAALGIAPPPWADVILMVPLVADGVSQSLGWRESTNWLRLITGMLFGMGMAFLMIAVVLFLQGLIRDLASGSTSLQQ
jgi:uncharacterized membrane protein